MRRAIHLFALLAMVAISGSGAYSARQDPLPFGVRITSPLGRSGVPGTVRIVAQVNASNSVAVRSVRFYVDKALLREVDGGPPWATEWVDGNPFESTEIRVEATDDRGNTATDKVMLKPVEIHDESHVASVLLETSVQDRTGRFIAGLRDSDFLVREDGVPQHLEVMREEEVPSNIAVLVDSSQSMSRRVEFVRDAAARLTSYLRPRDRIMIVPFSKHLGPITGPTNDRATVGEAVSAIEPRGGTSIMDSLIELAPRIGDLEGRNAIVLITDGYDENSEKTVDQALDAVKAARLTVYVVGIGGVAGISIKGERALRRLANETGGRLFLPAREEQLPAVHDLIASDVQHRYLMTYTPTNQDLDGNWRAISVATRDPSLVIRTRKGYFAPRPPPINPSLEFTITDSNEQYLNVEASDLSVSEDGVEQTIDTFEEAISPVSIVLVLDESGSMKKASAAVQEAARRFVRALRAEDKLALVLFSDGSELTHDLTTERSSILMAIDNYKASGGTALYDALSDALLRLRREEGRRAVVVLTDGRDEDNPGKGPGSTRTFEDVIRYTKETDAVIFGIGLGPSVDAGVLKTLASTSGGESYFPTEPDSLDGTYQRIVENLRRRWIISYTSTNSRRDGAWRSVEVKTRIPNAIVKTKGGYFAPSK